MLLFFRRPGLLKPTRSCHLLTAFWSAIRNVSLCLKSLPITVSLRSQDRTWTALRRAALLLSTGRPFPRNRDRPRRHEPPLNDYESLSCQHRVPVLTFVNHLNCLPCQPQPFQLSLTALLRKRAISVFRTPWGPCLPPSPRHLLRRQAS